MIRTSTITLAALTLAFLVATGIALAQAPNSNGELLSPLAETQVVLSTNSN